MYKQSYFPVLLLVTLLGTLSYPALLQVGNAQTTSNPVPQAIVKCLPKTREKTTVLARAVENDIKLLLCKLFDRSIQLKSVFLADRFELLHIISGGGIPGNNSSVDYRKILVRNDQIGIELKLVAEPVADGTGAVRAVE